MKVSILFSGSKGNCTYITDGETSLLVDAGGCLKRIREALEERDTSLDGIKGIFITHEHTDHIKALYNMVKKYDIRIFTTVETARAICTPSKSYDIELCRQLAGCIMTVKPEKLYEIGTMTVKTFSTPHDAANSLGFVFESTKDKTSIGYATDIGYVTDEMRAHLTGVKNIIIESNHDLEMLRTGPYPEYLKERIASQRGHLSNTDCAEFVKHLVENGARSITLAHLSEENNMPTLALKAVKTVIGDAEVSLKVALAYTSTEVEIY